MSVILEQITCTKCKQHEFQIHCAYCGEGADSELTRLRAEMGRLRAAVEWACDYLEGKYHIDGSTFVLLSQETIADELRRRAGLP